MTDARTVIAATLRNTPWPDEPYPDVKAGIILHALTQAGYAVVKLPEPTGVEDFGDEGGTVWETGIPDALITAYTTPPEVFIDSDSLTPDQARVLAAALLAAANKADTHA